MTATGDHRYDADVRWTTHGVAHVKAADWGSLGFGQAWACARDHLPTVLDQVVKVRSERAAFHGRGRDDAHLASDMGYLGIGLRERAQVLLDAQGPESRAMIEGATAGINAQLAEQQSAGSLPDWCADAAWIRPLDVLDLTSYLLDMLLLASGRALIGLIGRAEAPGPDGPAAPSPMSAFGATAEGAASNGWAFGGDATASGGGLVMGNPHFPWDGEARFWECHLTLQPEGAARPELDAYGASLVCCPGVQIGFNRHVAWTHTVSKGHRFTLARLSLVPGRPTAYRFGDEEREMTSSTHTVQVAGEDPVERTLWRTHQGPMVNMPLIGWGLDMAFTYRDANIDNHTALEQWLAMDRATSIDDLDATFARYQGIPWVNTIAADTTGRAWYVDGSATPNLSEAAQARFRDRVETDFIAALLYENRVAMVDGSEPDDEWIEVPDARSPGLIPYSRQPQIERRDVVVNANDSHWLTVADAPLEGYSALHGFERVPQSPRTRQNLLVAGRLADAGGVTTDSALDAVLANEVLTAELLLEAVVERARAAGSLTLGDRTVALTEAADVLAAWDRRDELTSAGAALWREFVSGLSVKEVADAGPLFAEPFDAAHPVATPRGLAPDPDGGPDQVLVALVGALDVLAAAGVAIDAPLGEVQWAQRGDERIALHGGNDREGILNIITPVSAMADTGVEPRAPRPAPVAGREASSGLAQGGYPCTYGASLLFAVDMTPDGPVGEGLLAYGQSSDRRSPHHVDGAHALSAKATRPLLFDEADIAADPNLTHRRVQA